MAALAAHSLTDASPRPSAGHVPDTAMQDAQHALEVLLALGTRILDGDASAPGSVATALAVSAERLRSTHILLWTAAQTAPERYSRVLAGHAAHRERCDLAALDELARDEPEGDAFGRKLIVTALTLLSNLAADERWYQSMSARERPSGPLRLV